MSQYQSIPKISKANAERELSMAEGENLCLILLSLSEIDDWKWVQETYLSYISNSDKWVASAAITGLGQLARISGDLDKDRVVESLEQLSRINPSLSGKVQDSISDINMFVSDDS